MTSSCVSGPGLCCAGVNDERDGGEPSCALGYIYIVSAKEAHDKSKLTVSSPSCGSPALSPCCARLASVSSSLSLSESRVGLQFCFQ